MAVVGVVGTASGSIITQRATLKSERLRADREREAHQNELKEAADRARRDQLRELYTELNTKARHYRAALTDCVAHLSGERPIESALTSLEAARQAFAECNSRAQMRLPWSILGKATGASVALGDGYRAINADMQGLTEASLEEYVRRAVNALRDAMRADLGLDGPDDDD